jgi:hypothetical protein
MRNFAKHGTIEQRCVNLIMTRRQLQAGAIFIFPGLDGLQVRQIPVPNIIGDNVRIHSDTPVARIHRIGMIGNTTRQRQNRYDPNPGKLFHRIPSYTKKRLLFSEAIIITIGLKLYEIHNILSSQAFFSSKLIAG